MPFNRSVHTSSRMNCKGRFYLLMSCLFLPCPHSRDCVVSLSCACRVLFVFWSSKKTFSRFTMLPCLDLSRLLQCNTSLWRVFPDLGILHLTSFLFQSLCVHQTSGRLPAAIGVVKKCLPLINLLGKNSVSEAAGKYLIFKI